MKTLSHTTLFWIDGIGALVTSIMLSQVLARFEDVFGIPPIILYWLSGMVACFMVYSLTCAITRPLKWKSFLRGISIANMGYVCITLGLIVVYLERISRFGLAYYAGEIIIIMVLSWFEWKHTQTFS